MKLAIFSAKGYDKKYFSQVQAAHEKLSNIDLSFIDFPLSPDTVQLAKGAEAVCAFVNDNLSRPVLEGLSDLGVTTILLRCAGFNNVDLDCASQLGLSVANVPSYSPEAVGEFAVALLQTVNRKTHRAYNRVREGNFNLDGLLGRTLHGTTVGVVGTGRIGIAFARIMVGFGCKLLAYDVYQNEEVGKLGGSYESLDEVLSKSDFVSLHCPLMEATRHLINSTTLAKMKPDAILINTSRGGLIDTKAVIKALKARELGGLALDVYEGEGALFYNDHSADIIQDDELMRLMTFPNVVVCGHQAFFTEEALTEIAECSFRNLDDLANGRECKNSLVAAKKPLLRRESIPHRI